MLRFLLLAVVASVVESQLVNRQCSDTKRFVDGHNNRRYALARGSVQGQPAASEMKLMIWDEELAEKASKWAARNKFEHNPDRTVPSGRFGTGENIYKFWTSSSNAQFDVESAMKSWWDEYKDYSYEKNQSTNGKQVGHYTQMAWSDSTYVGCGTFKGTDQGMTTYFVVCNYGPPGNYVGQKPYKSGQAAGRLTCGVKDCSRKYGTKC